MVWSFNVYLLFHIDMAGDRNMIAIGEIFLIRHSIYNAKLITAFLE